MRIIAGTARGRRLEPPPDRATRPTLDRVRESLFNILAPRLEGAVFADLFAGTGANGLEALSRGAASAVFVESDGQMLSLLRRNVSHCGFEDRAVLHRLTLPGGLSGLRGPFDLVFADPPWRYEGYGALLEALAASGVVRPGGWVVLESGAKTAPPPDAAGGLEAFRRQRYGETLLSFYA
ncbi:MAG TPA: 16S rRNA (guanine(966)-N(2))-methyltransferase RsmD [Candidatus Hydrogenedentes bacterium]|nr:16S rRNA (guanine(966)-N(2))-methyltransferase RsmD [Candidatus Hydrogenedentota bacterium]HOH51154.1 16S rRNA (guanine(966)-N(2))-methyltransferase RsmD [Candidatus Hydrogenedentota bacterium]HRZ81868.1 16S rRNA (guanine(966)-N(2))-methyltransferase RsmD [Candidatus Hydrogenedentota bacterium]